MHILLLIAFLFVAVIVFVFYGMRKSEESVEKKLPENLQSRYYDYYLDAIEYVTTGFYDDAVSTLKEIIDKNPDEYPAYLLTSYILRKQGKIEKALNIDKTLYANKELSKRGKMAILKSLLIDYNENGMYKTVLKTIETELNDTNDIFILRLAKETAYKLGNYEKAFECGENLLKAKGEKGREELAYIAADLAETALSKNDITAAEKLLKKGEKINSNCERLIAVRAGILYAKGDIASARKKYIELFSKFPDTINHYGEKFLSLYEEPYDKFFKAFKPVVEKNISNVYLHFFLSRVYKKVKRLEDALEELVESILYEPNSRYILLLMLDIYIEMGNWEKVKEIKDELKDLEAERTYVCKHCGKEHDSLLWYCDGCGKWGTIVVKL